MAAFKENPMLGHITTFGGHPVVCASAAAFLKVLTTEIDYSIVPKIAAIFHDVLIAHPEVKEIRNIGLMFAIDMESAERVERVVKRCLEKHMLTFWFLSHPYSFRLAPPLTITEEQARHFAQDIYRAIQETKG
jgi:acetylornithine/succinyldiaminopimelate/putrescine aminotransferase